MLKELVRQTSIKAWSREDGRGNEAQHLGWGGQVPPRALVSRASIYFCSRPHVPLPPSYGLRTAVSKPGASGARVGGSDSHAAGIAQSSSA